jgi:hypothetical protein
MDSLDIKHDKKVFSYSGTHEHGNRGGLLDRRYPM